MQNSEQIKAEIEKKLGFFPPFFEPAQENQPVLANLWHQTQFAYLDNPFPAVFKEKLSAYLSRYCSVPYCLVCHCCSLRGFGINNSEILYELLLPSPLPSEIHFHLSILKATTDWLKQLNLNSALEDSLLRCAIFIAVEHVQADFCRQELYKLLGDEYYEHLVSLIAYVKTCHLWIEAHPGVSYEDDKRVRDNFIDLLSEEPSLRDFFNRYPDIVSKQDLENTLDITPFTASNLGEKPAQQIPKKQRFAQAVSSKSIFIIDPHQANHPVVYSNLGFSQLTGYQPDEIIGGNWNFFKALNAHPRTARQLSHAIAQGIEVKAKLLNHRKNGEAFWNELEICPVFSTAGELLYLVGICADITRRTSASTTKRNVQQKHLSGKPKGNTPRQRESWLEGIRIFAALAILVYHAHLLFTDYVFTPQPTGLVNNLEQLLEFVGRHPVLEQVGHILSIPALFGFQFVDVFVLISGFSLVLSVKNRRLKPLEFFQKRLIRLLLPFWTAAWLSYPVLWAIGIATNSYIPNAWSTFVAVTFPLVFSSRGEWLLDTSGPWWFIPLMVSFTLIFPLLWHLLQYWKARNFWLTCTLITILYRALAVYSLGGHPTYVIFDTPANEHPFQILLSKLSIFATGMVVAQTYQQEENILSRSDRTLLILGIPLYLLGFICQFYRLGWVFADILLPLGLTPICIAIARRLSHFQNINTVMLQLGKYSYSFFLIHNFVVDRTLNLVVRGNPALYYTLLPLMILGTLLLAIIADFVQPLLKRFVVRVFSDINFLLTDTYIQRQQTWIPKEGDWVCYHNEPGWKVVRVEQFIDSQEFYICKITKGDRILWIDEIHLQRDRERGRLRKQNIQPTPFFFKSLFSLKEFYDFDKLLFTLTLLIALPTIFYYYFRLGGWNLLSLHFTIATVYLFTSVMMIYEATRVWFECLTPYAEQVKEQGHLRRQRRKRRRKRWLKKVMTLLGFKKFEAPKPMRPLPRCTCIVVAYLPNEQDIILDTLTHILSTVHRSEAGLELILAYNTPTDLPIEERLQELAAIHPEFRLLRVEGSKSKAENLNAAIQTATGVITCILDSDHHPCADCFVRAWQWLESEYHVVQGRSVIRNSQDNLLTQMIAIEFESIYGVSHPAKTFMVDTAIFGGSNGYWNTSVLQRIRFNPSMLTEDIDASLRTLVRGYRIVHDRKIVSTEVAPTDFKSFWSQRKRWAQGWLEVTLKYQRQVWKSPHFNRWQKLYWTYLLYYRELFSPIALQIFPIIFSYLLLDGLFSLWDNGYLWLTTLVTLLSGFYQTFITMQVAFLRYPHLYFIQYAVLTFFYTTLKHMISLVGLYDHLKRQTTWVVTPRQKAEG